MGVLLRVMKSTEQSHLAYPEILNSKIDYLYLTQKSRYCQEQVADGYPLLVLKYNFAKSMNYTFRLHHLYI